jgi:hypothetical protein
MLQKLNTASELHYGQILVVDTGASLMVGVCTGTKEYPGKSIWFQMNPNKIDLSRAVGHAREHFGDLPYLSTGGGFLGFDKQRAIYEIHLPEAINE